MSVTSESYTTNSIKISVSNETTPENIISAVDTAITSLGWSQYDYIAPNSATNIDYFNGVTSTTGTVKLIGPLVQGTTTWTYSGTAYTTSSFSFASISQTSTSGVGYGAIFTVTKVTGTSSYSGTTTVTITSSGIGYAVGDTITISGAYIGGTSPTNDLVLTVGTSVGSGSGPWTARITGMSSNSGFSIGQSLTATAGTGTLYGGSPTSVVINDVVSIGGHSGTAITYTVTGGTTPTAGTITNILIPAVQNTWSPLYTYVYRALCVDNTNYKYLIIEWDPTKQQFFTSAAEGWNTTTHLPLNKTYGFNGTFGHGYDLKDCQILVSGTARHFMIWPWIRQSPGLWSAIFEFERVAVEDTPAAGNPNFAWTNSIILGYTGDNGTYQFVFPRLPNAAINRDMRAVTNKGITTSLGNAYNYTYGWDITKSIITSFSVDHVTNLQPLGRAYNCSITKPFGDGLDTTNVPLATEGWADSSGTNTPCLILPLNGGLESSAGSSSFSVNLSGRPQNNGYSASGVVDMVLIGTIAWCACGTGGIKTYDTTQTVAGGTLVQRLVGNYDKLVFDGFRTIYAIYVNSGTGGTTMARIDTETYNAGTLTLAFTPHQLAIDGANVYVGMNGGTTTPRVAIISRWSTTDGLSGTGFTLVSTYTPSTLSYSSFIANIFPDYRGNIYIIYTYNSTFNLTISSLTNSGQCGIDKVSISTAVRCKLSSARSSVSMAGTLYYPVHSIGFYFDPISNYFISIIATTNSNIGYLKSVSTTMYGYIYVTNYSPHTLVYSDINTVANAYNGMSLSSWPQYGDAIQSPTGFYNSGLSSSASTQNYGILQNITPFKGLLMYNVNAYYNSSYAFHTTYYTSDILYAPSNASILNVNSSANSQFMFGNYKFTAVDGTYNNYNYRDTYTNGTVALKNINGNIYYLNKLYNMNSTTGTATGRLILKG